MSKTVTVYGASDDLIEVEGAITAEFSPTDDDSPAFLAFSDGTVLKVRYDEDGVWVIRRVATGSATFDKAPFADAAHTDRVTLTGDALAWVVFGSECEVAP